MAKWYGAIGFRETSETSPGVWTETITERKYYGEILRNTRRYQTTNQLNNDLNIANEISIIADPFANQNFHAMCYVEFMGAKWKISNINVEFPRLILTVGGLYNGGQA